jgi:hypothetical protein
MKEKNRINVILDIEFTGLDNTYTKDNEIIQVKMINMDGNELRLSVNYFSDKEISAYGFLSHRVKRHEKKYGKFSFDKFKDHLERIGVNYETDLITFYGFGTQQDVAMLAKYGINITVIDIREWFQRSKHELRMANEGSGLEATYYIVTGRHPELTTHDGIKELEIIADLYLQFKKIKKFNDVLSVMPHGHCAGMPLTDYVYQYRRAADGYRFNNTDLLSRSLDYRIESNEPEDDDDDLPY